MKFDRITDAFFVMKFNYIYTYVYFTWVSGCLFLSFFFVYQCIQRKKNSQLKKKMGTKRPEIEDGHEAP